MGIVFEERHGNTDTSPLAVYSDSDWAGCRETRASTSGFVTQYNGGCVSWRSSRQRCVATSSSEAEFVAGSAAAQEAQWLRSILRYINPTAVTQATTLFIDNTGAAELANDTKTSRRSKHIDIKYHHLRRCVADRIIRIARVNSASNLADLCTKPLDKVNFIGIREGLGRPIVDHAGFHYLLVQLQAFVAAEDLAAAVGLPPDKLQLVGQDGPLADTFLYRLPKVTEWERFSNPSLGALLRPEDLVRTIRDVPGVEWAALRKEEREGEERAPDFGAATLRKGALTERWRKRILPT
ncbi:MAG: hypothetical protein BJ554DRAFT_2837 [Olpidium bornovanus]|uniref:Uncharacterized protein n=1 Tax=Olpidium bornovanus TaxID=278681 RepID=A0A8H8DGM8_9FUNG|nr:MAG: hypothetical protein BJ554DRAFT_2837 [Olpidium bornovanus]